MEKINSKIFLKQLFVKDLFGKDSYRGVSLTYAWLANQLGHFTLGFLPSIVLSLAYKQHSPLTFSLWVAGVWTSFEFFNLVLPLFKTKKDRIFKLDWKSLIYDTITDVLYFVLGAMYSAYLLDNTPMLKWINIGLVVLLFYPFVYWYTIRIYQQYAYFPFQFRLSQWKGEFLDEYEMITVKNYIKDGIKTNGNHILIYGSVHEGKSNLGVAIANELALLRQTCTYTTATKLYSDFNENMDDPETIWNWKTSKFLVIDDISPDKFQINSPEDFLKHIDNFSEPNDENRKTIKETNIIWVLGINEEEDQEEWSELLHDKLGIDYGKISVVNLSY